MLLEFIMIIYLVFQQSSKLSGCFTEELVAYI